MKYPTRIYYTEADKALMWERWQKGESLHAIARHFGRSQSSIRGILASVTGGMRGPGGFATAALCAVARASWLQAMVSAGILGGGVRRRLK